MILSFKSQFVQPINDGTKIHTLREDPADRWKPGMIIHFATGVRTPQYNNWRMGKCISTQRVTLEWQRKSEAIAFFFVKINGHTLHFDEATRFAHNDGFNNLHDFEQWFKPKDIDVGIYRYSLKLLHWTQHRY